MLPIYFIDESSVSNILISLINCQFSRSISGQANGSSGKQSSNLSKLCCQKKVERIYHGWEPSALGLLLVELHLYTLSKRRPIETASVGFLMFLAGTSLNMKKISGSSWFTMVSKNFFCDDSLFHLTGHKAHQGAKFDEWMAQWDDKIILH